MPPKPPTESHTPGALEAVMADAAATTPTTGGEPVPVSVSMPAVESAPAAAEPSTMPSIGGVTEPTAAGTDAPAMPSPGGGFGLGEHDLEHPVLPTNAATAANPDVTAAIEGSTSGASEPAIPATPPVVTTLPSAEPTPPPAMVVNEAGAPTGSQQLGPTDKLIVSEPSAEPQRPTTPETASEAIPTPEEWVKNANEGLQQLLNKELKGETLTPEEIRAKDIFLAVLSADLRHA